MTRKHSERSQRRSRLCAYGFGLLAFACGGASLNAGLESGWQHDGGREATQFLGQVASAPRMENGTFAVGVVSRGLVGRSLPNGPLWTYEGPVNALPCLSAGFVGISGGGQITVLDAKTGKVLWTLDSSERVLEGMGSDGQSIALLLTDDHDARPDVIVVVGADGRERFRRSSQDRFGTPAIVNHLLLLPWAGQYVSAWNASTGESLGRLLLRDAVTQVVATDAGVFALGRGAVRLEPGAERDPSPASLRLDPSTFPGEPRWPVDGAAPRRLERKPIGFYAAPEGTPVALPENTFAATYYKMVMGLDQKTGTVRWANQVPRSVIGATAHPDSLGLCLEDGTILRSRWSDGSLSLFGSLEQRLSGCVLSLTRGIPDGPPRPPLETQISEAILSSGAEMASAQAFLVKKLAERPGEKTTALLLSLVQDPIVSAEVVREATLGLGKRVDGLPLFLEALKQTLRRETASRNRPYSFEGTESDPKKPEEKKADDTTAKETVPPENSPQSAPEGDDAVATGRVAPVRVLAEVLGREKYLEAAETLAAFLDLPLLPEGDALAIMKALRRVGRPADVPRVRHFFTTYQTTGGNQDLLAALREAAVFVHERGTAEDLVWLKATLTDSTTHPAVSEIANAALKKLKPKAKQEKPATP